MTNSSTVTSNPVSVNAWQRAGTFLKLAASLAAIGACVAAIWLRAFSGFAPWDDEGYVMVGLRSFLRGHILYDQIYSQYGPFYYLIESVIYWLFRMPVTHDAVRAIMIGWWVLCALLCAGIVYRLTRSKLLTAAGFLVAARLLAFFTGSPGHPEEICLALTLGILLVLTLTGEVDRASAIAMGCMAGALAMTKINMGAFASLAVLLVLLRATNVGRMGNAAFWAGAVGATLAPFVVLGPVLSREWALRAACFLALSLATTVFALWRGEPGRAIRGMRFLQFAVAAFVGAGLITGAVAARGTTMAALMRMTVLQSAAYAGRFYTPLAIHSMLPAAASLLSLAAWLRYRSNSTACTRLRLAINVAKGPLGCLCLLSLAGPLGHSPATDHSWGNAATVASILFNVALPFSWFLLVPYSEPDPGDPVQGRRACAAMAVLTGLYPLPVAGAQLVFSAVLLVPVCCVFLSDFGRAMAPWVAEGRIGFAGRAIAAVLLALAFSLDLARAVERYRGLSPLGLPGAQGVRVTSASVASYQWVTARLRGSCRSVYSYPGMFSFNFWTGIDSPTDLTAGNWLGLLEPWQQERIARDLASAARPCVVYSPELVQFWRRGQDQEKSVLVNYLRSNFGRATEQSGYQILVRRSDYSGSANSSR